MKEDFQRDSYVVTRPRLGFLLVAAALVLVGIGIAWSHQRDLRRAAELQAAASGTPGTPRETVGTTGAGAGSAIDGENSGGPPAVVPPAIIQELDTITGSVDGQELIGRRVDLHVPVQSVTNDVVFWVGAKDNRVLVVLGRDTRDGRERQVGLPPRHGISSVQRGQQATISGFVQRLPKAEDMHSWRLTQSDYAELLDRKMYIRADTVTTDGHGEHGSGI
jgi:hypothetical protein